MVKSCLFLLVVLVVALFLAACTEVGYYAQCVSGHWDIMRRCRSIDDILANGSLPDSRRTQLQTILAARDFASASLGLPDNNSYRKFVDLDRPYAVWNVVAAPEFSLQAKQWCFPVAGCVSYRGYFNEAAARKEAGKLGVEGYETDVYGVQAYSTLNWFDDPVLSTFLDGSSLRAVALIFHELAHQVVYVADDSCFNEAFARTVELEGVRRWLVQHGTEDEWRQYQEQMRRSDQFQKLLHTCRERLAALYENSIAAAEMRSEKQKIFAEVLRDYDNLKLSWDGYAGYDPWMAHGLNNARLASLATYQNLLPAFQGMLAAVGGDLPVFYERVRELSVMAAAERLARLDGYVARVQAGGEGGRRPGEG